MQSEYLLTKDFHEGESTCGNSFGKFSYLEQVFYFLLLFFVFSDLIFDFFFCDLHFFFSGKSMKHEEEVLFNLDNLFLFYLVLPFLQFGEISFSHACLILWQSEIMTAWCWDISISLQFFHYCEKNKMVCL